MDRPLLYALGMLRLDRLAAWSFLPYVVYLVYASRFGYMFWKLNKTLNAKIRRKIFKGCEALRTAR